MRCFWDERQRAHAPQAEFFNGALHPAAEHGGRVESVLAAIGPTEAPGDHGAPPLLRVHSADYLEFLRNAHGEWQAAGREGDAFPYTFPVVRRRPLEFDRIDAKLGQYSYDTSTPIGEATWHAVYWGAQTALGALAAAQSEGKAFAFCRPPGHHAGRDYCGGYSYLNNAAVAAEQALADGARRVAILDVDYHHGNGTQDIFAGREDVLFASLHADPRTDYPFFWGHADENGGNILNLPLPRGTEFPAYDEALACALEWLGEGEPELLIVSFGADTYAGDPISHFALQTADYARMAERIATLGLPALIVMEGGYAVEELGTNVAAFLNGF
ncbi:MAG: Deacetylases, including yeast histone deacetylase and acetoin utilization protein [uncultured Sphingomonas sp.]|uniref:Deacetylases, including yeast histone deacetylase and acetoin utilization protein n=1 Tax=uncultured Sphingomonas sp. TaxID=158754 RepID=A0A6J4TF04_9SPHN|nr:histone deacetylase family protein [uncultured Sphingomonas sp.]CAA9521563.1 MAG: Deacetylases, including yeast histone deacetylase and acetoin utilization protein [uncultured Sphingomonas sp.]